MLTKRIIPCMDIKDGRVVKGVSFTALKDAGDPVELAKFYNLEGADELVFLDITATENKRQTVYDLASRVAKEIFIPFTVGGGIKSMEDIHATLSAGADKVSIESVAVLNPNLISEASKYFGSQAVVVSVSARRVQACLYPTVKWEIYIKGGKENTGIDLIEFLKKIQDLGAGEILLNSIDEDGKGQGYDLKMLRSANEVLQIPLIASSGAGELAHFYDGIDAGADAVLAASVFHPPMHKVSEAFCYGKFRIKAVKEYLKNKNVNVRL